MKKHIIKSLHIAETLGLNEETKKGGVDGFITTYGIEPDGAVLNEETLSTLLGSKFQQVLAEKINEVRNGDASTEDLNKIISDSLCLEKAGAVSILLEGMLTKIAKQVTTVLAIPTIGIGSSNLCDGQILVTDDMLGLSGFYPKFVKKYANLEKTIDKAVKKFDKEVKLNKFPLGKNSF